MWTVIDGFDRTDLIDAGDISITQTAGDPSPSAKITVNDSGSQLSFSVGQEVIIWNEDTPAERTSSGRLVPATPGHNLILPLAQWTTTGALAGLINNSGFPPFMTFSNATYSGGNNYGLLFCNTPAGYVHAGQQYMFSVYCTITTSAPLVNAQAIVKIEYKDGLGNVLSSQSVTFATTTDNAEQHISVSAVAPSGATTITASFGGIATVSGSNSGTITFGAPQLEPMWFVARGVSYPTPDINEAQVDCAFMPDSTTSRITRFFSGFVQDIEVSYDGPNRQWELQCAGPGALLEDGQINGTYTGQYDSQILASIITAYFAGRIAINAQNTSSAQPLTQGAYISSISYNDNTLREVINGLSDASGYTFYIDPYYRLYYQPSYFDAAGFQLTDGFADNVTTFNHYDYALEYDGTQLKRRIKIVGGQFTGSYQDVFSGNGSTKQFNLTFIPSTISTITVSGTVQRVGVYGRDSFASNDVLVNTQSQYILFNVAPSNASNNIVCTYSYDAPITTLVTMQTSNIIAPAYAVPYFDSKVNDSSITDLATATTRGLAEIVKFGNPLTVLTFKASQFAPAGSSIYFTSSLDGIVNAPVQVQSVTGTHLGNGINEFAYKCGTAYQPTLVDHIRNANKALNRSSLTSNATPIEQTDVVIFETVGYHDSLSATVQTAYATSVYGTGHYGSCAYGGMAGIYGSARYGTSYFYS